jgi:hypothetical protein
MSLRLGSYAIVGGGYNNDAIARRVVHGSLS